jgi:hypothetical protein
LHYYLQKQSETLLGDCDPELKPVLAVAIGGFDIQDVPSNNSVFDTTAGLPPPAAKAAV